MGATNLPLNSSFGDIQAVGWNEDPANLVWQLNGVVKNAEVPVPATLASARAGARRIRQEPESLVSA